MWDAQGREQTSPRAEIQLQEAAPTVGLVLGRGAKLSSRNGGGGVFASPPPSVVSAQGSLGRGRAMACGSPAKGNAKMPRRSAHFCCWRLREPRLCPAPPGGDFGMCFRGGEVCLFTLERVNIPSLPRHPIPGATSLCPHQCWWQVCPLSSALLPTAPCWGFAKGGVGGLSRGVPVHPHPSLKPEELTGIFPLPPRIKPQPN